MHNTTSRGNAHSSRSERPKQTLITPSQTDIERFGGPKAEPARTSVSTSIAGLKELAAEMHGTEMFEKLCGVVFGPAYGKLRERLREDRRSDLGDEINNHFEAVRAMSILLNNGASFKVVGMDDRLGENMDIALATFDLPPSRILLPKEETRIDAFKRCLDANGTDIVGQMLMRTESDYIKLLVYYCKLHSFEELASVMRKWEEKRGELGEYKSVHGEDPIEFICGIRPQHLELLFQALNVNSMKDYFALFFDAPHMASLVGENFDNVMALVKAGKISDVGAFLELFSDENTRNFVKNLVKAKKGNLGILIDVGGIDSIDELGTVCSNPIISNHIGEVDYGKLGSVLEKLITDKAELKRCMYEIISRTYTPQLETEMQKLSQQILSGSIPKGIKDMFLDACLDADYGFQNLATLSYLLASGAVKTDRQAEDLLRLKGMMGGFITPQLSKRYLAAESEEKKTEVIESYRRMMAQTLGSGRIDIDDRDLLSEIIYLAYRPTGYSMESIKQMLPYGLQDLTHQLSGIKFDKSGYRMSVSLVRKTQGVKFDTEALHKTDMLLFRQPKKVPIEEIAGNALSMRPKDADMLPMLFGHVLRAMADSRVANYKQTYMSDKGASNSYTELRLETLNEITRVMPKEEKYREALRAILEKPEVAALARESADRYLWLTRKRNFSKEDVACKAKIDEILKNLQKDGSQGVGSLVASPELKALGRGELEGLSGMDNASLARALIKIRNERYLGYSQESGISDFIDVYYHALITQRKMFMDQIRGELRKIKVEKSGESAEISAILSKNVGSYFAKAGAELCTSNNMAMWREERHVHLNLVANNQIIGNVMLYFEPERDYLVARGFNPRNDAMEKYDRYSLACEIVRVVTEIARENGYREVFAPEQTGWHALSNRDGMAKEITALSKRNIARALAANPEQRSQILHTKFFVTEEGGVAVDTLNLLSVVG